MGLELRRVLFRSQGQTISTHPRRNSHFWTPPFASILDTRGTKEEGRKDHREEGRERTTGKKGRGKKRAPAHAERPRGPADIYIYIYI